MFGDKRHLAKVGACVKCGKNHPTSVKCLRYKDQEVVEVPVDIDDGRTEEVTEEVQAEEAPVEETDAPAVEEGVTDGKEEEEVKAEGEGGEEGLLNEAAEAVAVVAAAVADGEVTSEEKGAVLSELSDLPASKPKKARKKASKKDESPEED